MNIEEQNLIQGQIDEIFNTVNKLRRAGRRELTKKEIEKLINKAREIA